MPRKNKFSTNKDIVKVVSKRTGTQKETVKKILDCYLDEIKENLLTGKQVRLANFGTFDVTNWQAQLIYDINRKEKVEKEIKTIHFKDSQVLHKKVLD